MNGELLRPAGRNLLSDGERLWPHFDNCFYLRTGRDDLVDEVVSLINRDERDRALGLLLCDRRSPDTPEADLRQVEELLRSEVSFHDAIELLGYGGLGWYFEHRWIIPTYLSGLSLLHRHVRRNQRILELGSGVGHLTAHWEQDSELGSVCSDVVFSHLWLSQRYLRSGRTSLCFDANGPFPLPAGAVDVAFGHDSLHYLSDIPGAIAEMRRVASSGTLIIGHLHNAEAENYSAGQPLTRAEYERLVDASAVYDDSELTLAWLQQRRPRPLGAAHGRSVAALAFVEEALTGEETARTGERIGHACGRHPAELSGLMVNPLLSAGSPVWPSRKFVDEYVQAFPYLENLRAPGDAEVARINRGEANEAEVREWLANGVLVCPPDNWY
ncbi:class I SAM-dependent methyltransferase [Streptomyces sannanensis]|uniref:class I SAM-dependent methyltransferase n=1 Tax=Streptomyces sannanensis TaxID=285536 RepID=UPI0031E8FAAB